jgi:predicted DNA binding CopG/RHH family protein
MNGQPNRRERTGDAARPLDAEERALAQSIEKDEWVSVPNLEELRRQAREYAEATIHKDMRMNIRMSERDLRRLKQTALEEGIPYQTLVSMVLHKYLTGRFSEREAEEARTTQRS